MFRCRAVNALLLLSFISRVHVIWGHIAAFNPHRTHLVDVFNTSLMFRGNAPIVNGSFSREQLQKTLQEVARNNTIKNTTLPDEFHLIVISMLNRIKPSEAKVCINSCARPQTLCVGSYFHNPFSIRLRNMHALKGALDVDYVSMCLFDNNV